MDTIRSKFQFADVYAWEMALHWYGMYDREQFEQLDADEQARIIALYRIHQQVEGIIATERIREMKRASRT